MISPPELLINDKALNEAYIAFFLKTHLKKAIKPTKNPTLSFSFEKCTMK